MKIGLYCDSNQYIFQIKYNIIKKFNFTIKKFMNDKDLKSHKSPE